MNRVTFGVACSPFVAIHTTWKAAEDWAASLLEGAGEEVVQAVKRDLYVDDALGSAEDEKTAIEMATKMKSALTYGDFHLVGWKSNSKELVRALEPHARPDSVETECLGADADLMLGISWRPKDARIQDGRRRG